MTAATLPAAKIRGDEMNGWHNIQPNCWEKKNLYAIITTDEYADGSVWYHISVSCRDRLPSWDEITDAVRSLGKPDHEAITVIVPPERHINNHPNCLHAWQRLDAPWHAGGPSKEEMSASVGVPGMTPEESEMLARLLTGGKCR